MWRMHTGKPSLSLCHDALADRQTEDKPKDQESQYTEKKHILNFRKISIQLFFILIYNFFCYLLLGFSVLTAEKRGKKTSRSWVWRGTYLWDSFCFLFSFKRVTAQYMFRIMWHVPTIIAAITSRQERQTEFSSECTQRGTICIFVLVP